jgi:hypothetical protein
MKFLLAMLVCAGVATAAYAQKKKVIENMPPAESPIDSGTQLISYTMELETSLPDSVLYKRAMHWYRTDIKSMRVQDDETRLNSRISGRGEFDLLAPADSKGTQARKGRIKYSMETVIEGSKAVTVITRINLHGSKYQPIEPWLDEQKENYEIKFYLLHIEEQAEDILRRYKAFVNVVMSH